MNKTDPHTAASFPLRFARRVRDGIAWRTYPARRWLRNRLPHKTVVYARARAWMSDRPLPPGDFTSVVSRDPQDRTFLLRRAKDWGPIFSATSVHPYCIVVTDFAMGRRLLANHTDDLMVMTIDVSSMVPGGFMRQMRDDTHRRYRKALVRAILSDDPTTSQGALEQIVTETLGNYMRSADQHRQSPAAFNEALTEVSTGMLLRLFCRTTPGSAMHERLMREFQMLGPTKTVWDIGPAQHAAFHALRRTLRECVEESETADVAGAPTGILHRLHAANALDESMLGNLIYMIEMGRHDVAEFFRWLVRHAGANIDLLGRIASESDLALNGEAAASPATARPLAHAFVLETLRTNQSDRLMRRAIRDFVFEGWLIPKRAIVRVSMWEAHQDERHFEHPLRFDPSRFTPERSYADSFSPFGLDQHICPFAGYTVQMGTLFLSTMARHFIRI